MEFFLMLVAAVAAAICIPIIRKNTKKREQGKSLLLHVEELQGDGWFDEDNTNYTAPLVRGVCDELDHDIDAEYFVLLIHITDTMMKFSGISNSDFGNALNKLDTRLRREVPMNFEMERLALDEYHEKRDAWLDKVRELWKVIIPLFPKLTLDEEDKAGQTLTTTTNLIGRAYDPHGKIGNIIYALHGLKGSGFKSGNFKNFDDIQQKKGKPEDLARKYLSQTLVGDLLLGLEVTEKTYIPFSSRFEHQLVIGGTGHGKTKYLQQCILGDIEAAVAGKGAVFVMDGQGDLIRTISQLHYFDPQAEGNIADKLLLVNPNDIEYPVCLNMFDMNMDRINGYSAADREQVLNATIDLYEYFFGALLGAELTQRQGVIFKYLARLMFAIPDATIHTMLDVMENGEAYQPYIDTLDPIAQRFYKTQFFDKSFDDVKKQIARRLWGILSNGVLERMFNNPRNKIDLFEAMNEGKIILVDTAKNLLQPDGSAIFGRFFIALLVQAVIQRQAIPEDRRRSTFAYIDEIVDYIKGDNRIEILFNQARKYKLGLTIAGQNLEQFDRGQEATILASTSTKVVGGLSSKDARKLDDEMRTNDDFLMGMQKRGDMTRFAYFVKNITPTAIELPVHLGQMDDIEKMPPESYDILINRNRAKYCASHDIEGDGAVAPTVVLDAPAAAAGARTLGKHDLI